MVAVALATALGGCTDVSGDRSWPDLASLWSATPPATAGPDPGAAGRQAARSIWGVVPSAPQRKADLRPELISGAAVAVSADTLLASCGAVQRGAKVGLVRHNKYRIARVTAEETGQICRLTVTEGPLTPAAGYRSFADLRVGEPVVALTCRTSAEVAAAPGWLAGKGSPADPFLEATSVVPPGTRSVVLVDGFGNLVGLGEAGPLADGLLLTVPVGTAAPPSLANADLGGADVLLASLAPSPRTQPVQAPLLLIVSDNDSNRPDRAPRAGRTAAADDDGAAPSGARPGNGTGSSGSGTDSGVSGAGSGGDTGSAPSSPASSGNDPSPASGGAAAGPTDPPGSDVDDGGGRGRGAGTGRDDNRGRGRGADDRRDDDNDARGGSRGRGSGDRGGSRDRGGNGGGNNGGDSD